MSSKRVMPDMFGAPPERPPRVERSGSKFSHYIPSTETPSEPVTETPQETMAREVEPEVVPSGESASTEPERAPAMPAGKEPDEVPARRRRASRTEKIVALSVESDEDEIWSVFTIPHIDVVIPVFDNVESLLEGPLVQTPLHVLPSMEQTFRRLKVSVRTSGRRVSFQTLYAHALAYAYVNSEHWLYLAPSDGRREGSRSRLTSANARITPELPAPLLEATHALAAKAAMSSPKNAPALESVKTAALAWSLGRYGDWLDGAVAHPVKAGEKASQRPLS